MLLYALSTGHLAIYVYVRGGRHIAHIISCGVTFWRRVLLTEGPAGELGCGVGGGVSSWWPQ